MRSIEEVVEATNMCLDSLAAIDLSQPCDSSVRSSLLELLTAQHRLAAQLIRLIGEFDRRALAPTDGHPTTKAWLQAFGRLSGHAAHAHVRTMRTLRLLPDVAAAFAAGLISAEHVDQLRRLHDRETDDIVTQVEHILLRLATVSDPTDLRKACDHVRYAAHANEGPDGPDDPESKAFQRRQLTLSRVGDLWHLTGQLDPEAGAKLRTALEAYTAPPADGDARTAAQRRHDALHTLVSQSLEGGRPPTTGGYRPQLGVLVPLDILVDLPARHAGPTTPTGGAAADDVPREPIPAPQVPPPPFRRPDFGAVASDAPAPGALATAVLDSVGLDSGSLGLDAVSLGAAGLGSAGLGSAGLSSAGLSSAGLSSAGLGSAGLGSAGLSSAGLSSAGLSSAGLSSAGLSSAGLSSAGLDQGVLDTRCAPTNGHQRTGNGNHRGDDSGNGGRKSGSSGRSWLDELHRRGGFPDVDAPHGGLGPQPAYLEGWGPISNRLAQRLACDATLYRVILDPRTGLPLDVGRAYRCAPPWIRKALWIRDRHCRWPGCKTEASWCDAHHYVRWNDQKGATSLDNLILLCRYHHVLVHEGRWTLHFDPTTAEVFVIRPDGERYELGATHPQRGTTPTGASTTSHPPPTRPDP